MAVEELHYTSVKAGPGGSSGFQFVKLTGGADAALCRQIQPLLGYEPPRGAPARPTPEDIAAFPVALSYALLPQGGAVLCNTTYTGADYSGRYGNFYAHALYLPGGPADLGGLLPIETWRSPSWCTRPDDPAAAAAGTVERGTITDTALCGLARHHGPHLGGFLTDVLNSFGSTPKRILLVEGDADTAAWWIALACRSLPRDLAGRLTFTTYTQRPYMSPHQVTGMPVHADFAFSEAEITSQYRVHHSATGRSSPPEPPLAWAMAAAALWQAGKPELFDEAYHGLRLLGPVLDAAQAETLTGQLAVIAVAHDVDIPAAVFAATVNWAEGHPGEGTAQFWHNFAAAVGQGRGKIPAQTLGRLCRTVSRHWPDTVTGPLLSAYLAAVPAALLDDPHLDTGTVRWAISRAAGHHPATAGPAAAAVRQVLPRAFQPGLALSCGLVLLELADALQVSELPPQAASQLLAPALLAGGDAAAAAAGFLEGTPNATLPERVLDCLHDEARSGTGPAAAQLADAVADWTRPAALTSFPLLQAAADLDQARRSGQIAGTAAAFCRVMHTLGGAGLQDPTWYAWRLACPSQALTAGEARDMFTCTPPQPGQVTHLDRICLDMLRRTAQLSPEVLELAGLLRARAGERMGPSDAALLDAIAATGRLQEAARRPSGPAASQEATAAVRLLCSACPLPQPVREAATAALLAVLLSPVRLEANSPGLDSEIHELAMCDDGDLIDAYARQAGRELPGRLAESPALHAWCFWLWWREEDLPAGTAWHAAREGLVRELLAPAARRMTRQARAETAAELDRRQEGLGQEWLQLVRRSAGARSGPLTWARHMLRKTLG